MLSISLFLYFAVVVAAEVNVVPTISPTFIPTTTLFPTVALTNAPIPAPVPVRPCYSNLTEIKDLVGLKSPFIVETYILCPDTIYVMGSFDPIGDVKIEGWDPIFTRANSIFQCGDDGKSSNNCVITGGDIQILHEVVTYNQESKDNVVIKGITFEDAASGGIILAASGQISLIDCIFRHFVPLFKNHQNNGVIQLLYCDSCFRLRKLMDIIDHHENKQSKIVKYYADLLNKTDALATFEQDASRGRKRFLQEGESTKTQVVTVDGCLFENNFRGSESSFAVNGVIYLATASNEITIKNSIFRNNDFANQDAGVPGDGYALASVEGAKVTILDTCFIDNLFSGKGAVVVEGSSADFTSINVFGTIDDKLACSFASISSESCVVYDSATCNAASAFGSDSNATTEDSTVPTGVADSGENTSRSFSVTIGANLLVMIAAFGMGL